MADSQKNLILNFVMKGQQAVASTVSSLNSGFQNLTGSTGNLLGGLNGMSTALFGVGFGVIAGFAGLTMGMKKAVEESSKYEESVFRLNAVLKNQGIYTEAVSENLKSYANELQRTTSFGDEEIINANAIFLQYGLSIEQTKKLTKATMDLAVAKNWDLSQAAEMVARSVGTETNALKRAGVEMYGAAGSAERVASAIEGLNGQLGGQAQAYANTYAGKLKTLNNATDDLWKTMGNMFLPGLIDVVTWLNKGANAAQNFFEKMGIGESLEATQNRLSKSTERVKELNNEIYKLSNTKVGLALTGGLGEKSPLVAAYKREKAQLDILIAKDKASVKAKQGTGNEDLLKGKNTFGGDPEKAAKDAEEAAKKASNAQLDVFEAELLKKKTINKMTLDEEISFWDEKIAISQAGNTIQKEQLDEEIKKRDELLIKKREERDAMKQTYHDQLKDETDFAKGTENVLRSELTTLKQQLIAKVNARSYEAIASAQMQAWSSLARFDFGGFLWAMAQSAQMIAGASLNASLINSVKFAEGGIVGGSSMNGDRVQANLNSGEMVLTTEDQKALLGQIRGGGNSGNYILRMGNSDYQVFLEQLNADLAFNQKVRA